jgi:hypothetical protein
MRRALGIAAACAALVVGLAAPAAGQLGVALSGERYRESSDKYAVRDMVILARCIVKRRYDRARTLVLAPQGSAEQREAADKVVRSHDDPCLSSGFDSMTLSVQPEVLMGGVAQALVLKDYPDLPAVVGGAQLDAEAERTQAAQLTAAERFGRCLVRRDAAAVQALLAAEHGSPASREAVAALKEDMGMCLAEGSTLRINELFLRNVTGVAAYRLAQQLSPRGAGGARGEAPPNRPERSAHG